MQIDRASIASPCDASWSEMSGDERAKFCSLCSKSVHHLSAMTEPEAEDLLETPSEDGLCVRYSYQPDTGEILFADSAPTRPVPAARRSLFVRAARAAVVLPLLAAAPTALASGAIQPPEEGTRCSKPSIVERIMDRVREVLEVAEDGLSETTEGPEVMGEIPLEPVVVAGGIRAPAPPVHKLGKVVAQPEPIELMGDVAPEIPELPTTESPSR